MCQTAVRMECSRATVAFMGPRRAAMRQYFAAKEVFLLRETDRAAMPRAPLRYLLPGRLCADLIRPADSLAPGQTPVREACRAGVSKRDMSAPVSAMITSATLRETPGMLARNSLAAPKGVIAASIRPVRAS